MPVRVPVPVPVAVNVPQKPTTTNATNCTNTTSERDQEIMHDLKPWEFDHTPHRVEVMKNLNEMLKRVVEENNKLIAIREKHVKGMDTKNLATQAQADDQAELEHEEKEQTEENNLMLNDNKWKKKMSYVEELTRQINYAASLAHKYEPEKDS